MDIMGGDIDVQSVQGEGSTFTVTIPVLQQKNAPTDDGEEADGQDQPAKVSAPPC